MKGGSLEQIWQTVVVLCALLFLWLSPTVAQTNGALQYRRVYVPQNSLEDQIHGLLPLRRDDFERRLKLAEAHHNAPEAPPTASIEQVLLRARLEGNELKQGTAEFQVECRNNQPALLPLAPCSFSILSARWQDDAQRRAIVGSDAAGRLWCWADKSGTLVLEWCQPSASPAPNSAGIELSIPAATRRTLEITTPPAVELTASSGLLTRDEASGAEKASRTWRLELTGAPAVSLTVSADPSSPSGQPPVTVRETSSYYLLPSVVDVDTSLTFDILRQPLTEATLEVDPRLSVTQVRMGEQNLAWRAVGSQDSGRQAIQVELPGDLVSRQRTLQVMATGDCPVSGAWRLPRICLRGGIYQEGKCEIQAAAALRLEARPLAGAVQRRATAGRGNDQFEFDVFDEKAEIEVSSDPSPARFVEHSGTQINVESSQVTGVFVAELRSLGGNRFSLVAELPRHWIVDSVETQPAEMLADRSSAMRGSGPHQLQIKLARALSGQSPMRLVIRAHYRRPANSQPLGRDFFQLARFPEAQTSRRLVAVRVNDPEAELHLTGDDQLQRLDPSELSPDDLRLFELPPGGLLFEAGMGSQRLGGKLQNATPRYRAEVTVRVEATRDEQGQRMMIRCQPESSAVSALLVRIAPPPAAKAVWHLASDASRPLAVLVEPPVATAGSREEATYRILLPQPQNEVFEIHSRWAAPPSGTGEVSLAWLPEANRQLGLVEVFSPEHDVQVTAEQAESLPYFSSLGGHLKTLRARYRYDPDQRARFTVALPTKSNSERCAWIEELRLASQYSVAGIGQHQATFVVRNTGANRVTFRLPPSALNCRVLGENTEEETAPLVMPDGRLAVTLPPQEHCLVRLRYSSDGPKLGRWPIGQLTAPVPRADLPVISQAWAVALPPGWVASSAAANKSSEFGTASTSASSDPTPSGLLRQGLARRAIFGPGLAVWEASSQVPEFSWSTGGNLAGWQVQLATLPTDGPAALGIYCPAILRSWSLCLALVGAWIGLQTRPQARWQWPIAALLSAAALWSPPSLAWLLFGLSGGLLAGAAGRIFWPRGAAQPVATLSRQPRSTILLTSNSAARVVALVVLAAAASRAVAERGAEGIHTTYSRVVFPVDEQQQPAGGYVYLEPVFYEGLHRASVATGAEGPAWLLESARYDLPPIVASQAAGTAIELRGTFDLQTFQAATTISLPLGRSEVLLLEGQSRLDGEPVPLAWRIDGLALEFTVPAAGKHRLELALAAAIRQPAGGPLLDLAIPPAAVCTVMLPAVTAEKAQLDGAITGPTDPAGQQSYHLANSKRLALRWPVNATRQPVTSEAEQLLWWTIRSGSVTAEAHFRIRPLTGQIRQVVIEADPRLHLLPGLASGTIQDVSVEEGLINHFVKVSLPESAVGEIEFRLSWLWPEATGVGQLFLPQVAVRTDRLVRSWTAISAEPQLQIGPPQSSLAGSIGPEVSAADFLQAWGNAEIVPSEVLVISQQPRTIVVRPRAKPLRVQSTSDWSVSSVNAHLIYTGQMSQVAATRFEHRLKWPRELKVSTVELRQGGRSAALRWRQADDAVVVNLLEVPTPEQILTIVAEVPLPKSQPSVKLPVIQLADSEQASAVARIYRQEDVLLMVEPGTGWSVQENPPTISTRRNWGQLAVVLASTADGGESLATIKRSPNQARVTGKLLIRANEADGDWRGEVLLDLDIAGGVVDELRLSVPEEWTSQLQSDPAMDLRLQLLPGELRRTVTLHPRSPLTGKTQIRLHGPLHGGASGLPAPDVSVMGHPAIERFVQLDRGSVGARIDWERTGLVAASAAVAKRIPAAWQDAGHDLYRAVSPRFDALATARQNTTLTARAYLSDVEIDVWPGRRVAIVNTLVVDPAGTAIATFTLPFDSRLVQVTADGNAIIPRRIGPRAWQVDAHSKMFPYRLSIVCDCVMPANFAAGAFRLALPQLVGMEVLQTQCLVRQHLELESAAARRFLIATPEGRSVELVELELRRMEAAGRALEDVAATQGQNVPQGVFAESFIRWRQELIKADQRIDLLPNAENAAPDFEQRRAAVKSAVTKIGQRLLAAGAISESDLATSAAIDAPADPTLPSSGFIVTGSVPELVLSEPTTQDSAALVRYWIPFGLALAGVLLWPLLHWPPALDWLAEHWQFVLAAAAAGWWLIAPLGVLGWIGLLFAVWLALAAPWHSFAHAGGKQPVKNLET